MFLLSGLLFLKLPGCSAVGYPFAIFEGDTPEQEIEASYTDLAGRSFAVMVMADDATRYRFPTAQLNVSQAMTGAIGRYVEGVSPVSAEDVIAYQEANPYWSAVPPSRLIEALGVERLIVVDVAEYRTQEPGNAHLWRGVIDAAVAVHEAESADPDNKAFEQQVRAQFPAGGSFGLTEGDHETMQLGVLKAFTRRAAGLFYGYTE